MWLWLSTRKRATWALVLLAHWLSRSRYRLRMRRGTPGSRISFDMHHMLLREPWRGSQPGTGTTFSLFYFAVTLCRASDPTKTHVL
jgi:hypothetical protein